MKIKRSIFYIAFFCFSTSHILSQEYVSFPDDHAQWGIEFEWEGEESIEYTSLSIIGDTVINNLPYTILNHEKAIYSPFRHIKWEYFTLPNIFFREKDRQIFIYEHLSLQEYLYYDFNLQVNDTFVYKSTDSLLVVKEIEMFGRKGIRLKRMNNPYLGYYLTVDWLQEMGSLNGLLYPAGINAASSALSCFQHANFNPLNCENFHEILDINLLQYALNQYVFPNPADNFFNIHSPTRISEITIVDINGTILKKINKYTDNQQIDVSFLNPGVYIIQINSTNLVMNKILIKL